MLAAALISETILPIKYQKTNYLKTVKVRLLESSITTSVVIEFSEIINEPQHDKTNKKTVHPAKTKISLGIRPV